MKKSGFLNKGWLCLCLFCGSILLSCGSSKNLCSYPDKDVMYVRLDKGFKLEVIGDGDVAILPVSSELDGGSYTFYFAVADRLKMESLKSKLLSMGALEVSINRNE
ncbi:hypothetical protein [Pedobacter helvus]|uniref:Lipoprotein n=1 Tax=Pedobacter helvus TaxID=2563444 RepID=A0ABW9JDF1_9SPHI|nr:hypothetical protein [Pedobacter ureilyticus]